jgi:hypothetical protein
MGDLRVFLCVDLEHDRDLHDLLLADARRRAAFQVAGRSEAGEMTEAWAARARDRIAACDELIVICGEHTDDAPRVSAELRIAQQERKPYVLLWGRRESMCKKPASARHDDGIYRWTSETLDYQLAFGLRRSREREVPEHLKRQVAAPRS